MAMGYMLSLGWFVPASSAALADISKLEDGYDLQVIMHCKSSLEQMKCTLRAIPTLKLGVMTASL